MRKCSSRALAIVASMALFAGVIGVSASPALAKNTKPKVLLQDPLTKPSKAVKPASPTGTSQVSWSFANGRFVGQPLAPRDYALYGLGSFGAANISIDVQAALLTNTQTDAGVICRGQDNSHFYLINLRTDGTYTVYKDTAAFQTLASGTFTPQTINQVRLTCSGPTQPGPTDTVTITGAVNGQTFATQDSSSPYPARGAVDLWVGAYSQAAGGAGFSKLKITQNG